LLDVARPHGRRWQAGFRAEVRARSRVRLARRRAGRSRPLSPALTLSTAGP
jgi:hypothetical protein